jgi:outer membrane receptor for ferrienterochelin and colicin
MTYINAANTIQSPGYHLVDALAEYAVNSHLSLRFNVYNLTDECTSGTSTTTAAATPRQPPFGELHHERQVLSAVKRRSTPRRRDRVERRNQGISADSASRVKTSHLRQT